MMKFTFGTSKYNLENSGYEVLEAESGEEH